MKIEWRYQYVPEGQLEPDEYGRWQIIGSIWVKIDKAFPEYAYAKKLYKHKGMMPVKIAWISKGSVAGYFAQIPSLKYVNIGLGLTNVYGDTIEELKNKIQEEFNLLEKVFKYCEKER